MVSNKFFVVVILIGVASAAPIAYKLSPPQLNTAVKILKQHYLDALKKVLGEEDFQKFAEEHPYEVLIPELFMKTESTTTNTKGAPATTSTPTTKTESTRFGISVTSASSKDTTTETKLVPVTTPTTPITKKPSLVPTTISSTPISKSSPRTLQQYSRQNTLVLRNLNLAIPLLS